MVLEEKHLFIKILYFDFVFANILAVLDRYRGISANITGLVKIFMIIELLYVLYFLYIRRFKLYIVSPLTYLFMWSIAVGIIIGVANNQLNSKFFSHLYEYIMPLLAVSVGYELLDELTSDTNSIIYLKKAINAGAITYIFGVIAFRLMYIMNLANYNAYGSGTIDFVLPFLLFYSDGIFLPFLLMAAGVLSGKRSILVKVIFAFLFYMLKSKKDVKKFAKEIVMISIAIAVFVFAARNTVFFNRIILTVTNMFGEERDLDMATGGRTAEYELVFKLMGDNVLDWIFGHGFGTFIVTSDGIIRHYSHLTPLAYIMSAGMTFMLSLYTFLVSVFVRLKRNLGTIQLILACYMLMILIGSLFGATLINEPKMWLLIGMAANATTNRFLDRGGNNYA